MGAAEDRIKAAEDRAAAAEARLRQRDRDETDERERKRNDGWLDRIFGMFSGIGLFEMIFMALIVGGIYMAAKANPEWAEKLVNALPEDWQLNVGGMLNKIGIDVDLQPSLSALAKDLPALHKKLADNDMSQDVINVIAKDKATFDKFLGIVAEANRDPAAKDAKGQPVKGRVTLDGFTNSKTVVALITKDPEMALALAATFKPGSAAAKTKSGAEIMNALQEIVKSDKLDTLLTAHRATMVKLLNTFAPQVTEAQLNQIIDKNIVDGKVKDTFRTMLVTMMTPDASGTYPDAKKVLLASASADPEMAAALKQALYTQADAKPGDPAPDAQTKLQHTILRALRDTDAGKALSAKLGDQKLLQLMAVAVGDNPLRDVLREALKPEYVDALPQILTFVGKVPELSKELPFKMEALQKLLLETGYKDGKPNAALSKLLSDLSGVETINAKSVTDPMTNYILSPEIAQNPKTAELAKALLATLDRGQLSAEDRKSLETVAQKLTPQKLAALSAVTTNPKANLDEVLAQMSVVNPQTKEPEFSVRAAMLAMLNASVRADIRTLGTGNIATLSADMIPQLTKQNLDALVQFGENIGTTKANQGENVARTLKVVGAFTALLEGQSIKAAFKGIPPQELAGFFSVPENHDALLKLSKSIDEKVFPPQEQKAIKVLRKWVGDNKSFGITNFLRDPKKANDFLVAVGAIEPVRSKDAVSRITDGFMDIVGSFEWAQDQAFARYDAQNGTKYDAAMLRELRDTFKGVVKQEENSTETPSAPPARRGAGTTQTAAVSH